ITKELFLDNTLSLYFGPNHGDFFNTHRHYTHNRITGVMAIITLNKTVYGCEHPSPSSMERSCSRLAAPPQ
ncbi:MAG TPA: hypothetical protein VFA40_21265, partial [Terriglobales bacterium]|nr:hypothetical protein [Terriglobales bacterium]